MQRLPQHSSLGCYWHCRNPLWFPLGYHGETRWPIRSHGQCVTACNHQYDSNRTVHRQTRLTFTPSFKQPRLPRQPVSQQCTYAITRSRPVKLSKYNGMARKQPPPTWYPLDWTWPGKEAQFRSDEVPQVGLDVFCWVWENVIIN
jgi:hypothetical protein